MKIVEPGFIEISNVNPQKHIEEIARTCYKSTDLISNNSHKGFVKMLYDKKHWAMLEHFIFVYQSNTSFFESIVEEPYVHTTRTVIDVLNNDGEYVQDVRNIISFSARSILDLIEKYNDNSYYRNHLIELVEQIVADYDCDELFGNRFKKVIRTDWVKIDDMTMLTPEEQWEHGWKSIKFTCDRGVSHEIVRHRDASFAQESTRYCNYSKDKFGREITVIKPFMFKDGFENPNEEMVAYTEWKMANEVSEKAYFTMLDAGATPQEARSVLTNSLKTELIMTARNYEWGHFFELRCDKPAHPQMREIAIPLFEYFNVCNNTLFNRDSIKFED